MKKNIWKNVAMNVILSVVFVVLSQKALGMGLEETQVFLILFFGILVILGNYIFIKMYGNK